jgi:hypothetical protein
MGNTAFRYIDGLKLLDHLIIIPEGLYYSMTDEGIIWEMNN